MVTVWCPGLHEACSAAAEAVEEGVPHSLTPHPISDLQKYAACLACLLSVCPSLLSNSSYYILRWDFTYVALGGLGLDM